MNLEKLKLKLGKQRLINVVYVSKQNRYIYISNPKAACSSIKLFLSRCETNDPEFTPEAMHRKKHLPFDRIADLKSELSHNSDYYTFSFVRHPLRRAVSAYVDKIIGNKPQKKEILAKLGVDEEQLAHPVSFNEFVKVIIQQRPESLNPHWRPQVYNIYPDICRFDFIGKLESFNEDFENVKRAIGLPDFPMKKMNIKAGKTDPGQFLTPINRFRLARLYAQDYLTFGYRSQDIEYVAVFLFVIKNKFRKFISFLKKVNLKRTVRG